MIKAIRVYAIYLFACLGAGLGATQCDAQNLLRKQVSVVADQRELSNVIDQLQQQTGISFFYSLNAIGAERKITCRYFNVSLRKVLDEVFAPLQVQYKVVDNQVILFAAKKATAVGGSPDTGGDSSLAPNGTGLVKTDLNTIRGKVISEKGEPLEGASIVLSGSKSGTVTNKSGLFSLETDRANGVLQVSHTAYNSLQVNFSGPGLIQDIKLDPLVAQMEEVVVIGYGSQSRNSITTATSTIKGSAISDAPVGTVDAALQGRATGVLVSQQGGSPGSPVRIQIRGTSSISSGTEPLYIVDGIYIFQELSGITEGATSSSVNPLATLNPDDVASIEILKDAAATAIYGARGANGVILITTKQGKKGQGNVSVTINKGVNNPTKLLDYVSGPQWLYLVDKARANTVGFGITPGQEKFNPLTLVSNNLPTPSGISGPQYGPLNTFTRELAEQTNTNWRDMVLQQGSFTDIKVSAGQGFEKGNFYLSGQYWDEEGILVNQQMKRFSFRSNLNFSPSEKWQFGAKLAPSSIVNDFAQLGVGSNGTTLGRTNTGATGGWGQVNLGALPIMPVYNSDGTYFDPLRGRNVAAGADPANFSSRQEQLRFLGNVYAEFKPISSFTLRAESSIDFLNSLSLYWTSDVIRYNRVASEKGAFVKNLSATTYATYKAPISNLHQLTATIGAEWQKSSYRRQVYTFEGVIGNQQEIGEISSGAQTLAAVSGIFPDQVFSSLFARANYQYDGRFLFATSLRCDGASVFSPQNRIGYFPSVSGGWIASEEKWFKQSSFWSNFSFFKLRASYGQTGNAAIPAFAYLSNYVNWPVYGQSGALSFSVLGSPNIRWEKNNQIDAAIEFGLWNNRIRSSLGAFSRQSEDMLLSVPVAPTVGIGAGSQSVILNVGNLRNSGVEFEISALLTDNQKVKNRLKWLAEANFSWNGNKVVTLTDNFRTMPTGEFPVANGILQGVGITQIGGGLGTYYLAEYAGLDSEGFETIYEIDKALLKSTGRTARTGKIIRATQANVSNNRMIHFGKSGLPKWYGGITQTFQWLGFELKMHVTFQGGNYIYDGMEEATSYVRTGNNVIRSSVFGNTWSAENPGALYPKLTWNMRDNNVDANGFAAPQSLGTRTSRFLYRGDYVRLKTLSITYPLPAAWTYKLKLKSAKLYVSAQNLLTFASYPGFDPEILITGPGTQGRNLEQGFLSESPVPQVKTLMVGMNIVL